MLRYPLPDSEPIVEGVVAEGTDPGQDNPEAVVGDVGLEADGTESAPDVDDSQAFDEGELAAESLGPVDRTFSSR